MTRWTPELIDRIRALAAQGYSAKQVASLTGIAVGALTHQCCLRKISFRRMPKSQRPHQNPDHVPADATGDRLRQAARADLDHEIAMARAEAKTAPLFRGGP